MNLPKKNWLEWLVFGSSIVLVAGLLGFGGLASASAGVAQVLFVVFLVLFLASMLFDYSRRGTSL